MPGHSFDTVLARKDYSPDLIGSACPVNTGSEMVQLSLDRLKAEIMFRRHRRKLLGLKLI